MTRHAHEIGAFEIDSLHGQSQVAICHSFFVYEHARGNGKAHDLKLKQQQALDQALYDFAICTVAAGNAAQKKVLVKAGWKKLSEFPNRRSCEITELWGATV